MEDCLQIVFYEQEIHLIKERVPSLNNEWKWSQQSQVNLF